MINGKKVIVIMPAYNAEKTLEKTYNEIYQNFVDEIILVDDFSFDETKEVAKRLNITTIVKTITNVGNDILITLLIADSI